MVEPAAGAGILVAALAEHVAQTTRCRELNVVAYETDAALCPALALALGFTRDWLTQRGIRFDFAIRSDDFILANATALRPTPLFAANQEHPAPQLVIANPPYFKLPKSDSRVVLLADVVHGQPNIYALFMAASAKLLQPDGQLIFITPRSFCSGPYFRQFRKWFFQTVSPERLHLFESRTATFEHAQVIQETVILSAKKSSTPTDSVTISSSPGIQDLETATIRRLSLAKILDLDSSEAMLDIPLEDDDYLIREIFGSWIERLSSFGLHISTGPIVPFRTNALVNDGNDTTTAPVLWGQHIGRMSIVYPLLRFNKPQRIQITPETRSLLLPNVNYVLIRRFSPKEDNSRITAAPYLKENPQIEFLGIENHVNYLYRPSGSLSKPEALGLAAFLNSRWVDRYFRLSSGNTQVSATELRSLPVPPLEKIKQIGERLVLSEDISPVALINQIVGEELDLPLELSNNHGGHEEAKDLLDSLGLPPAQRNELAALTLLTLASLTESDPWQKTQRRSIRIHDMIVFVEKNYHKHYAENTRETFRHQVLHQFEQARLVDRNPDDPALPTNSPRTHYALSDVFLPVAQNYGTRVGQRYLTKFKSEQGTLLELYQQHRMRHLIPLRDAKGLEYLLSPGKHNQLQVAVIEQFAPRFAPGAKLLYIGDTAHKTLIMDSDGLAKAGFPADKHNKLPDIVLFLPKKDWLLFIEVVTAHGPVSPKRQRELETMLAHSSSERVYVSVFPDFKEYLRHARDIAWETEIWIAEAPDHLIYYNGDKFIGPPEPVKRKIRR